MLNALELRVLTRLEEFASEAPFGNNRFQLGLAVDGQYLGKEAISSHFNKAKPLGIKVITTHFAVGHSPVALLNDIGLLDSSFCSVMLMAAPGGNKDGQGCKCTYILDSFNGATDGYGRPIAFSDKVDLQSQASICVDCHSNNSASIVSEMRLLLQTS